MRCLFVWDIDGTIAYSGERFKEAGPEPSRDNADLYTAWVKRVQNEDTLLKDKIVPGMQRLLWAVNRTVASVAIYLTSREEQWRGVTEAWLDGHRLPEFELIMRPNGCWDEGGEFKEKMIKQAKDRYGCDEVVVFDDDGRGDIEAVCKRNGWTFFKARSGGQE